ncbi:MAG TPA: PEP-CTERM sorting domain-containing protein [Bryobacteraceae bacterium]|nr:PEP-CTERM sorting domain-containing protein [Bryobacteraceae bacterium]
MRLLRTLSFLVLVTPIASFASPISLGAIATDNVAIFGVGGVFFNNDGTAHMNVTGDIVGASISGTLPHFVSGSAVSGTGTAEYIAVHTAFNSVLTQLGALTFTPITVTSGTVGTPHVTTLSTPGDYSFNGTLSNAVIDLTGAGPYYFDLTTAFNWTNVTINAQNGSLTSDSVIWYAPTATGVVNIVNSNVFGDVVQQNTGNNNIQSTNTNGTESFTGRVLSNAGGFTEFSLTHNSTENLIDAGLGASLAPEPSTFAFLTLGLGVGFVALRRRKQC